MSPASAAERELQDLAGHLKKVEAEYTMYFSGRVARPPSANRQALEQAFRRAERGRFDTPALRFRFSTLQARYVSLTELWDRGVRAREEGRAGPFSRPAPAASPTPPHDDVVHATSLSDPLQEQDKLRDLYEALMQARREAGDQVVAFHRFAGLVKEQVSALQARHPGDAVWFRVTRRDGKVALSARAVRSTADDTIDS